MLIGYARVSTGEQTTDLQIDALNKAGCERIFSDTGSGTKTDRPGLIEALNFCRSGDVLTVWKLDRLGRSLKHLICTLEELQSRGVSFKSIQDGIDLTTSSGKLYFHMLAALAEFERDLIRERVVAGLRSARARGRTGGRVRIISDQKIKAAVELSHNRRMTIKEICSTLSITQASYYRYVYPEYRKSIQKQVQALEDS